jgi:hypothetical protein
MQKALAFFSGCGLTAYFRFSQVLWKPFALVIGGVVHRTK